MLKNYFKIGWRNLVRNRVYSAINIIGLAVGLAVCMLIMLYVGHESGYDSFHANAKRIFWVQSKIKIGNDSLYILNTSYATGPLIKQNEPSVESFLRIKQGDRNTIIQNREVPSIKFSEENFLFADNNFFSFFSFKLLKGNKQQVLQNPFSVVISENAAEKYFGKQNPVGKIVRYNNSYDFVITGVAEKKPSNSSINYDFVASVSSMLSMLQEKNLITNEENAFSTYFLLKQPKDISRLDASLAKFNNDKQRRYISMPLTDIHLNADTDTSNTKYLKVFPFVAALILLLALINYMSLSTARSTTRAKEIGVRKVLGANRKIIAVQFFIESGMYTAIAFVIAYALCILFQPHFFNFLQIDIDSSFLYYPYMLLSFAGLFGFTVLLAATYPSFLLSAYKPVLVLYGKLSKQSGGISVRKFFTVFQFSISIILIIGSILIDKQMYFIRHTDTGVNRQNVVMMPFPAGVGKHYTAFRKEIQSLPGVQQLSVALHPLYKGYDIMGTKPENSNQMILLPMLAVDQNFISLLGLKWKTAPADSFFYLQKKTAILNETAVEKLNLGPNPINKKVDDQIEVAGVLKAFNYASLQNKIDALCLFVTKDADTASLWAKNGGCVFAKINPHTNIPSVIQQFKAIYEKFDNEKPFEYYFMDDAFDAMYKAENRLSKIFTAFTSFTLLIACLGLFGLATFMAVQRTKEIGIRKVLGASVGQVTSLLSKDFLKLVLIAFVIASPIAWWAIDKWLQNFAYRTPINWWVFALSGLAVLVVALLTVSFQAIKAAVANPVKSLRTE
jgi:putative ABC transport system permease protein